MTCPNFAHVVAGSAGFLGSSLVSCLNEKKLCVIELQRAHWRVRCKGTNSATKTQPITEPANLDEAIESHAGLHTIFNTATKFSRALLPDLLGESVASNIEYPIHLAGLAIRHQAKHFVQVNSEWQIATTDDFSHSTYVVTKNIGEKALSSIFSKSHQKYHSIYLGDTFGPKDKRGKIAELLMRAFWAGDVIEISEPEKPLNLLAIEDVSNFLATSQNWSKHSSLHICAPESITVGELARLILSEEIPSQNTDAPPMPSGSSIDPLVPKTLVLRRNLPLNAQLSTARDSYKFDGLL